MKCFFVINFSNELSTSCQGTWGGAIIVGMKKLKITFSYVLGGVVLLGVVALAADSLSPSAPVGTTMKTMEDVYQKLTLNTYTPPTEHDMSTTSSPFPSMHSLADIWDAIPNLLEGTIATGTTIMGITGTLYGDTDPSKVLTTATYPGTATAGTPAIQFSTAEFGGYTNWNTGGTFCADLVEGGHDDWRLPTYTELVDASAAGDNPVGGFQAGYYWSGTSFPFSAGYAYFVGMGDGEAYYDGKGYPVSLVRCAR
jgi:hypothetical protein